MNRRAIVGVVVVAGAAAAFLAIWRPSGPPERVAARDPKTLRETASGPVVGFVDGHDAHAWLGIPFAKPPVGELRWKAPRPAERWSEPREALAVGSLCTQFASLLSGHGQDADTGQVVGEEDCLYLNVWAPPFEPGRVPAGGDALPVMLWIHGGGNSIGHGGSYEAARLAVAHGLVVLTLNYRLGPFGWFSHPALQAGAGPEDASGNYGTLDIVAALRWVQENAAAFGGDPKNVTIFGESAGAANVLSMMASPLARGLFHRAIVQSGGLEITPVAVAQNHADDASAGHENSSGEVVSRLLLRDGIAADRDAAKAHQAGAAAAELRDLLHAKSAEEIMTLYDGGRLGMISLPEMVGDGHVLPTEQPSELFRDRARYNDVPVILGTNRDEPKLFMVRNPKFVRTFLWIFPRLRDEAAYVRESRYLSDAWKAHGVDGLARVLRETQGPTVFAYRFDWDEEPSILGYDLSVALGAAHGLEIAFVFGEFESGLGLEYIYDEDRAPGRDALSRSMMSYWAEFAKSGNPGTGRDGREVAWLPWGTSGKTMIVLDTPQDQGIRMASDEIRVEDVRARLVADASFTDQREHCRIYVALFYENTYWDPEQYATLGRSGCREYDPESLDEF